MIQRYDISMNAETNRLSIKEFAVIERQFRKRDSYDHTKENFSLMYEAVYDGEDIREAINTGDGALISVLRSDNFFPIFIGQSQTGYAHIYTQPKAGPSFIIGY